MYVCMCVCMYVCMYVILCVNVCMCVCTFLSKGICARQFASIIHLRLDNIAHTTNPIERNTSNSWRETVVVATAFVSQLFLRIFCYGMFC